MKISDSGKSSPPINFMNTLIFIFYGISSLLAWNAIMSELPFFTFYLEKMDPATSFPFLNYALNIVLQFIMINNRNLIPLNFRLIGGLIFGIIVLILLPLVVLILEKNSTTNVITTGGIILFMGMINALCSGGFFALSSFFPIHLMIAFSAGQGFSGVMMNIIQYFVLAGVNSGNREKDLKKTAWIYFGISAGCLFIVLIILIYQLNSNFFKYYLKPLNDKARLEEKRNNSKKESNIEDDQIEEEEEKNSNLLNSNSTDIGQELNTKGSESQSKRDSEVKISNNNDNNDNNKNEELEKKPVNARQISFFKMFKILMDLDLLRTYINLLSNSLFPKAGVIQSLFKMDKYKTVTILIIYNFMDFFGRYIVLIFKQTKRKTYIISIGRSILYFLLIFNYYCQEELESNLNLTSILLIVYVTYLGLTHGIGNSLCFGLAPTMVEDDLKLQAGSSMSFFTVFGLFLGSCLAFLTKYILEKIQK